jgi:hypothetical protein
MKIISGALLILILFIGCTGFKGNILEPEYTRARFLKTGRVVIKKGDLKAEVKDRLGAPSESGLTLEGYDFYRYGDREIEIYFYEGRVIDWQGIEFRP